MKVLIFSGALERRAQSTSGRLSAYFTEKLHQLGIENQVFNLADSDIPLYDITLNKTPKAVELMNHIFLEADVHIWLSPLYHGSIPGVMKNCLDWLQLSAKNPIPYLTDKTIGMVCWADGVQAMQGINAMDAIARALRAWTAPYSVPIQRTALFDGDGKINSKYDERFNILLNLLLRGNGRITPNTL